MMWWDDGMGWGGWVAMALVMVAFWSLVIVAIVAIFRGLGSGSRPEDRRPRPEEILEERFARGEINADEYHARQRILRGEP